MERIKLMIMTILLAFLGISTITCATESPMRTPMDLQQMTLWQLIDELTVPPLFLPDTISRLFQVEFSEYGNNGYFSFYESAPLHLADYVVINKVRLSIKIANGVIRSLVFDISPGGVCVTRDDVHKRYPNAEITGFPRGGSLDEETVWAVRQPGLRLSFGFKELNRRCLASVGIGRNEPPFIQRGLHQ